MKPALRLSSGFWTISYPMFCISTVLILIPTRELALQTSAIVKEVGKHMGVQCMVTTGGTSLKDDIMRLYNTIHIIAAPSLSLSASGGTASAGACV